MKELLLIIFGFLLGLIPSWYTRKRRLKTHWCALKAEIIECNAKAVTFLADNIKSPLYRLPVTTFHVSFPALLADGGADEGEVSAISRFFSMAEEINRGLDNAAEMLKSGNIDGLDREYNRNCLKAKELTEQKEHRKSLYAEAKRVVDLKVSSNYWWLKKHI